MAPLQGELSPPATEGFPTARKKDVLSVSTSFFSPFTPPWRWDWGLAAPLPSRPPQWNPLGRGRGKQSLPPYPYRRYF